MWWEVGGITSSRLVREVDGDHKAGAGGRLVG